MNDVKSVQDDWYKLYQHLPNSLLKKVLLRTSKYDRIGPIKLPLEMSDHKTIEEFTVYYYGFYKSGQDYFLLTKKKQLKVQ